MLRKENQELLQKLNDRNLVIENSGSLAEAALQLNGVFEAAQKACSQYIENMQFRSQNTEEICRQMEQQTREKCDEMIAKAQEEARCCAAQAAQIQLSETADAGENL